MIVADLRTEVSKGSAAIKAAMEGLAAAAPGMLVKVNRGSLCRTPNVIRP